jgi:hypothetical protein
MHQKQVRLLQPVLFQADWRWLKTGSKAAAAAAATAAAAAAVTTCLNSCFLELHLVSFDT